MVVAAEDKEVTRVNVVPIVVVGGVCAVSIIDDVEVNEVVNVFSFNVVAVSADVISDGCKDIVLAE